MNPDEVEYGARSSTADLEHEHHDDNDSEVADYGVEDEYEEDDEENGGNVEEEGLSGEEDEVDNEEEEEDEYGEGEVREGGYHNIGFRLVQEDEAMDEDGDGVPTIHYLAMPGGMPFRVEILGLPGRRRNIRRHLIQETEPVPNPEGQKLMKEGQFGAEEWECYPARPNPLKRKQPHHIRVLEREIGAYRGERARIGEQLLAQSLVPSTKADFIINYDAKCYSGQFSQDGNFFYSCSQDFRVRMYDTSNPYKWKHYKSVTYPVGKWTITDATLSPDNKMLAYSTIASTVYATNTSSEMEESIALDFGANARQNGNAMTRRDFGIWSIRFSGDGREMVAGANDRNLYVYDIETRTPVLKMSGHQDDVNAVCFADAKSPHILFSGSDDTTIKVWDRRSMATGYAGVFCGHIEGLTYIDSKGDGRYVLSNAKDQTMKLWDIRKMMDRTAFTGLKHYNYSTGFEYRTDQYKELPARHPNDSSLVTFRGHSVLRTLIRCHFSPPTSSGSRYVYTGSSNGKVFIYNLDATLASIIDVHDATFETRPYEQELIYGYGSWVAQDTNWKTCVRDASWHPNASVIAASSWNGYGARAGSVSLHSWGLAGEEEEGGPVRMNSWGEKDTGLYADSESRLPEEEGMGGSSDDDDDEEGTRVPRRRYF